MQSRPFERLSCPPGVSRWFSEPFLHPLLNHCPVLTFGFCVGRLFSYWLFLQPSKWVGWVLSLWMVYQTLLNLLTALQTGLLCSMEDPHGQDYFKAVCLNLLVSGSAWFMYIGEWLPLLRLWHILHGNGCAVGVDSGHVLGKGVICCRLHVHYLLSPGFIASTCLHVCSWVIWDDWDTHWLPCLDYLSQTIVTLWFKRLIIREHN